MHQHPHGGLVLLQCGCDLPKTEICRVAQENYLTLLWREGLNQCIKLLGSLRTQYLSNGIVVARVLLDVIQGRLFLPSPIVVDHTVSRDPEEPGREAAAAGLV